MREIWRDIKDYEGLYQVSNLGNIRSVDHYASNGVSIILYKGRVLKQTLDSKKKYLMVTLSKNNKDKKALVHRVVAQTFLTNTENKKEVNHKNGIKTDNSLNNLEWVTSKENKEHAQKMGLYTKDSYKNRKRKPVIQFDLNNNEIKKYSSVLQASRETGIWYSSISKCCHGVYKQAKGYRWKYGS